MSTGQRIRQARKEAGLSQKELAARVGIKQPTLSSLETGDSEGTAYIASFANILGVNALWLEKGVGDKKTGAAMDAAMPAGAFPANHSKFRQIPVYGKAMGGFPERIWDEDGHYPAGFSDQYAEVASSDPNAFLVPVEGVSMIPRFNPGEFAMVEPGTEPEIEDDVLVRLGDGRTMIKKLLSRRGVVRLGSYNSQEIISAPPEIIVWMYYVAHPVPARKIKQRM